MASQRIPRSYDPLVSLAEDAADGARAHGTEIHLAQNTAATIETDLENLIGHPGTPGDPLDPPHPGAQAAYAAAKSAKTAASSALRVIESNARAYCSTAIDILRPQLGRNWNSAWQAAGFVSGSLAIPDDVLPLLGQLRAYFTAHPAQENTPLGITAAGCESQRNAIGTARAASNDSNSAMGQAKQARDEALHTLSRRLSGLLAELGQLLGDDDARWYSFGFDRPADGEQPGPIQNLVLTPGSPGMVFADWDDARRADRYRVFKQAPNDPYPVEVASTITESEYVLTFLPVGALVKITIVPVNQAGNGPESAPATITVP